MPRNLARIPNLDIIPVDMRELVLMINQRIAALNTVLNETEGELSQQKGNDGAEPVFNNNLNLRQHRITNGARSRDPRDVVIRQELIDLGLIGDASGRIVFSNEVEFAGPTTVSGPTGGSGIATGSNIEDAVTEAIEANVATSNDGDRLRKEQPDGTNGTTPGTVAMGRDHDGKARYLEMTGSGLRVDTSNLESLLLLLIDEIQELRNELGH